MPILKPTHWKQNAVSEEYRAQLVKTIGRYKDLPLCLSGGVDSTNLLFSFLENGVKPQCYTFQYGDYESPDVIKAKAIASYFGCSHTIVSVPSDFDAMVNDISRVIKMLNGDTRKTHIQCGIPIIYLSQRIKADGFNGMVSGLFQDEVLGTYKNPVFEYRRNGDEGFLKARKKLIENQNGSGNAIKKIANLYGVDIITPYKMEEVMDILLRATFDEVFKPFTKWVVVNAFHDYWERGDWYRKNASYQVVSGIRESHDRLLTSPYNIRNAKSVYAIYNDIRDGKVRPNLLAEGLDFGT